MCGLSCESAAHYSLECSRYSALRLSLLSIGAQFYGFMNVAGVVCWFLKKLNYYCLGTKLMGIVWSIVVRRWQRTIAVTMLLEHELTIVDGKSLLIFVNNDWTIWLLNVNNCQQWLLTTVVDRVQHNIATTLLTTLIKLFIFCACIYTRPKTHRLFRVDENSIEQCCAAHIVQCCQQYCSALLSLH